MTQECPIHGPLDPGVTECPYCLQAGSRPPSEDSTVRRGQPYNPDSSGGPPPPRAMGEYADPTRRSPGQQGQRGGFGADPTRLSPSSAQRGGQVDETVRAYTPINIWGWLIVIEGDRRGDVYPLREDKTDIGRGPSNHIDVNDPKVSDQHARVRVNDEKQFVLWDLASLNGTFLNGEKLDSATVLQENDRVKVGNTVMILKTIDPQ